MVRLDQPQILTTKEMHKVQLIVPSIVYSRESFLFYEGQIPHCAIVLISGEMQLLKKKSIVRTLKIPGTLIGAYSLINNEHSPYSLKIMPNSQMSLVGRSTLKEFLEEKIIQIVTYA